MCTACRRFVKGRIKCYHHMRGHIRNTDELINDPHNDTMCRKDLRIYHAYHVIFAWMHSLDSAELVTFIDDYHGAVLKVSRWMLPFVPLLKFIEIFFFATATKLLIKGFETLPAVQDEGCTLFSYRFQNRYERTAY